MMFHRPSNALWHITHIHELTPVHRMLAFGYNRDAERAIKACSIPPIGWVRGRTETGKIYEGPAICLTNLQSTNKT